VRLLKFADNVADCFPCDRGAWIQWLTRAVASEKTFCMQILEPDKSVSGYVVAVDQVMPPLSDCVFVLYSYSEKNFRDNERVLEALKAWAAGCGAKRIRFTTDNVMAHKLYGFRETGRVVMEMVI
jgi:hypothetical protein